MSRDLDKPSIPQAGTPRPVPGPHPEADNVFDTHLPCAKTPDGLHPPNKVFRVYHNVAALGEDGSLADVKVMVCAECQRFWPELHIYEREEGQKSA